MACAVSLATVGLALLDLARDALDQPAILLEALAP